MIYKLESYKNKLIEDVYKEAMKSLGEFWEIQWTENRPDVFVVKSRKEIDGLKGRKTEDWLVGWGSTSDMGKRSVYVLDFDKFDTESSHKKDEEVYRSLIAHELCHLFVASVANKQTPSGPLWWNEGLSTFLSGQLKFKKRPEKFTGFLDSNRQNPRPAYNEGGFVIELLINKFGKKKIIELTKSLETLSEEDNFGKKFKKVYGFELSYEKINELYNN